MKTAIASRRWGIVLLLATMTVMGLVVMPAGASARQPETAAGVHAAAKYSQVISSATSARHGVADLAINEPAGGSGYRQVWGYTGSVWRPLSQGTQDLINYPTSLPGTIRICHGAQYTIVRTGPGYGYSVLTRVTRDTNVRSDRLLLTLPGKTWGIDGLGWYRIRIGGRIGWVVSYRVVDSGGCSSWKAYWKYSKHR